MTRNRFIIGAVLLVLLGAVAGCVVGLEQPPETANTLTIQGRVIVDAYHYDAATGTYVHFYHHESENLVVNNGLDWIEGQLGDSTAAAATAENISLSESTAVLDATWTIIPAEIIINGLDRNTGSYLSTGTGTWEISYTFNATGAFAAVQLTGLNWDPTDNLDGNLVAANTFTPVALSAGDSLTVTWQLSVASV